MNVEQFMNYPMFLVETTLSNGSTIAFWVADFAVIEGTSQGTYPHTPGPGPTGTRLEEGIGYYDGPNATISSSLVADLTSWAENFDWSSLFGAGTTVTSVTVTKYTETPQNVTPV